MSFNTSSDTSSNFEWDEYLQKVNGHPADVKCFKQSLTPPPNHFEVGSLLEAEDQRSTALEVQNVPSYVGDSTRSRSGLSGAPHESTRRSGIFTSPVNTLRRFRAAAYSLARVVEVWGARIRVRLVGTDDRNDCWFLVDSDQIRPYPSGSVLQPPFGYMHNHLVWDRTLKKATEGAKFAEDSCFIKPPPDPAENFFQVGDKLEAVDKRNAQLICPATVGEVNGHLIMVRFDGWSGAFDYWARFDSRDLFPVGWCKQAEYPLQPPGPNALRTPNSHSTPSQASRLTVSSHLSPLDSSVGPQTPSSSHLPDEGGKPAVVGFKRPRRPRTKRSRLTARPRRLPHPKRLGKAEHGETQHGQTIGRKRKAKSGWPDQLLKPTKNAGSDLCQLPPVSSDDSADWSSRSQSSPPVIHREDEEGIDNGNYLLTSNSSSDNQPPRIDSLLLPARENKATGGGGSADACVVRLQAKSTSNSTATTTSPSGLVQCDGETGGGARIVGPELKSWQVVAVGSKSDGKLRGKERKKTSKRRKRSSTEHGENKLHKKLKLMTYDYGNDKALARLCRTNSTVGGEHSQVEAGGARQDTLTVLKGSTTTHDGHITSAAPPPFVNCPASIQAPLHLYCDEYHSGSGNAPPLEGFSLTGNSLMMIATNGSGMSGKACISRAVCGRRDSSILPHDYADKLVDEVCDTGSRNLVCGYAGASWQSVSNADSAGTRLTAAEQTSVDAVTQPSDDYLTDVQSLSAHMPSSSTVSPSSLDLGPCPLPKPTLWSIDEVYHYITTRDSSLQEVADIFKHHEIDGQALLLLSMESLRNYLKIKLGPALKVDHIIARLKRGVL